MVQSKIKLKAIILVCLSLVSIISLNFISQLDQQNLKTRLAFNEEVLNLQVMLLETRRREKDFLLRMDLDYSDRVKQQSKDISAKIKTLKNSSANIAFVTGAVLEQLIATNDAYLVHFTAMTELYYKRGLNEVAGKRGELRQSAHYVEAGVKKLDQQELTILLLQMRRHEKDYLIRSNPSLYIDEYFQNKYEIFLKSLDNSNITEQLKAKLKSDLSSYKKSLTSLVMLDSEIKNNIHEFRNVAHEVQDALKQLLPQRESPPLASNQLFFYVSCSYLILSIALLVNIYQSFRKSSFKFAAANKAVSVNSQNKRLMIDSNISTGLSVSLNSLAKQAQRLADDLYEERQELILGLGKESDKQQIKYKNAKEVK